MDNNYVTDKFMELFANGKKEYDIQKIRFSEENTFIRCYIKKHIMGELINLNMNCFTELNKNRLTLTEEELKNMLIQYSKRNIQILDLLFLREKEIEQNVEFCALDKNDNNYEKKNEAVEKKQVQLQQEKKSITKITTNKNTAKIIKEEFFRKHESIFLRLESMRKANPKNRTLETLEIFLFALQNQEEEYKVVKYIPLIEQTISIVCKKTLTDPISEELKPLTTSEKDAQSQRFRTTIKKIVGLDARNNFAPNSTYTNYKKLFLQSKFFGRKKTLYQSEYGDLRDEYLKLANKNFYEKDLISWQKRYSSPSELKEAIEKLEKEKVDGFPLAKGINGKKRKKQTQLKKKNNNKNHVNLHHDRKKSLFKKQKSELKVIHKGFTEEKNDNQNENYTVNNNANKKHLKRSEGEKKNKNGDLYIHSNNVCSSQLLMEVNQQKEIVKTEIKTTIKQNSDQKEVPMFQLCEEIDLTLPETICGTIQKEKIRPKSKGIYLETIEARTEEKEHQQKEENKLINGKEKNITSFFSKKCNLQQSQEPQDIKKNEEVSATFGLDLENFFQKYERMNNCSSRDKNTKEKVKYIYDQVLVSLHRNNLKQVSQLVNSGLKEINKYVKEKKMVERNSKSYQSMFKKFLCGLNGFYTTNTPNEEFVNLRKSLFEKENATNETSYKEEVIRVYNQIYYSKNEAKKQKYLNRIPIFLQAFPSLSVLEEALKSVKTQLPLFTFSELAAQEDMNNDKSSKDIAEEEFN